MGIKNQTLSLEVPLWASPSGLPLSDSDNNEGNYNEIKHLAETKKYWKLNTNTNTLEMLRFTK